MSEQKPFLELYRGETLLGILSNVQLYDWPWYRCKFQPTPAFEEFRPLFDREWMLLQDEGATEEWDAAYTKIEELNLTFSYLSQEKEKNVSLLHIHINHDMAEFKAISH